MNTDLYGIASIRNLINSRSLQHKLICDLRLRNKICSSLDTIEDVDFMLDEYGKDTSRKGLSYVIIYGLLQGLYIQQDAASHLYFALFQEEKKIENEYNELRDKVRFLRNGVIGHPTDDRTSGGFHVISRPSLRKKSFKFIKYSSEKTIISEIHIDDVIEIQKKYIEIYLSDIYNKLMEKEVNHKTRFKGDSLFNRLEGNHYAISKLYEGIFSDYPLSLILLESLKELMHSFVDALLSRIGSIELCSDDIEKIEYAIKKLLSYYSNKEIIPNTEALIYADCIRNGFASLEEIAKYIDEDFGIT